MPAFWQIIKTERNIMMVHAQKYRTQTSMTFHLVYSEFGFSTLTLRARNFLFISTAERVKAKQHPGFLREQTATLASHTSSIHLYVIRTLMLMPHKSAGYQRRVGNNRYRIQEQFDMPGFAGRLWEIFRSILSGALHDLLRRPGC